MDGGGDTGPLVLRRSLELPNHTDKRWERRRSVNRERETNDKTGETFLKMVSRIGFTQLAL